MSSNIRFIFLLGIATFVCLSLYAQRPVNEIEITKHPMDTLNQTDLIDLGKSLFHINRPRGRDSTGKKFYFSLLPFSTAIPGGGRALLTSTTAGFYHGDRKTTYMSRVTFTPYTNFGPRFGLPIRSYVWLADNKWVIDGDVRILKYPHQTWTNTILPKEDDKLNIDYTYYRFYQHVLKRIRGGFFMGIGYDLDYRVNIRSLGELSLKEFSGYDYGTAQNSNSISSGISLNLIFDTRSNSINTWGGNYANLQIRENPEFLGSDQHWRSLYAEVRRYHRLNKDSCRQNMIAIRNFFWTTFNSKAPYLDLPNTSWDPYNSSGRGLPLSRYRGSSLYYLEVEYRKDLTKNGLLGFVLFSNVTSVHNPSFKLFHNWNVAGGAGARIKFNKKSGTNVAIDYGISRGFRGLNLSLGEVF
ncbi:hypothetical protein [Sphingobacterium sp. LRF_L2]|uniref:hypothetical protein n=1 Tax=Sphingobacterium sp. LRF_L2 TaxID=3369421 RepID=UPI003F5F12C5